MDYQFTSTKSTGLSYGLHYGIASSIYTLAIYFSGFMFNESIGFIAYFIPILFIFVAIKHFRNKVNNGFITFSQGFKIRILASTIGMFITSLINYILLKFIDPSIIDQMIKLTEEKYLMAGMAPDQVEQLIGVSETFLTPASYSFSAFFMGLIGCSIVALVVAATSIRKPQTF